MSGNWPGDGNDDELDLALHEDAALQHLLDQPAAQQQQTDANIQHDGFDYSCGDTWIYPSNLPLRSYQHTIAQAALYRNTLVVLPTGLGKTFIAAVVMYNLHRWYPRGKVIFMAPTRPLVSQQINACQKIMPFPVEDTVELTGRLPRQKRAQLWASKRVFFATPQVVQSDMLDDTLPFPYAAIKLIVVDEAHRAKGRYAYTQVAESIFARNPYFRVLALSATPGRTIEDVASVCRNLYISHLEVRWDNSIDVMQYVHARTMRTIIVRLGDSLQEPRKRMLQIIDPYLRQLIAAEVLSGALTNINRNFLLFEQKRFQERAANGQRHPEHSLIVGNFAMCISLYHALELLERHGLRVFVSNFDEDEEGREKFVLVRDAELRMLVDEVRQQLGANPFDVSAHAMTNGQVAPMPKELDFGHPKYEQARQVLLQHFQAQPDSRAIVFCEYRESVMLIQRLLLQHTPLMRPRCFVGQGGTSGSIRALTQKQQLQIMDDFRSGRSNVLVATSIGEEGIDVGEVELIVCFDICSSNPTRFVQRIGRTGRQKRGHVVMLATEGREQQVLKDVLATRDQTNRKLLQSCVVRRALYDHGPRLVPLQFSPKCVQKFMEPQPVAVSETPKPSKTKTKTSKAPPAKKLKSHDLRKFFQPQLLDTQDRLAFEQEDLPLPEPYKPSEASQQSLLEQCAPRNKDIKNFLSKASPTATNGQQEAQRLRKLNRLLQGKKSMLSEVQRAQDLAVQLQDKELPRPLKLFLLQQNRPFVRDICHKIKLQQQLEHAEQRLNNRQQRTRRQYEQLLDICGSAEQLEQLLLCPEGNEKLNCLDLDDLCCQEEQDFESMCADIFKGLDEQGICADNYELVQQQLKAMQHSLREEHSESRVYDGGTLHDSLEQFEDSTLPEESCQKSLYQSQMMDFKPEAVEHQSTPRRARPLVEIQEQSPSRIEASDLSINLSRLNDLLCRDRASAASTPLPKPKDDLLQALEENLSTFDQLLQPEAKAKPKSTAIGDDLNIDLNDFLEPLPEEQELLAQCTLKETINARQGNCSPDLFAEAEEEQLMSPWRPATPQPLPDKIITSPAHRAPVQLNGQDKSPSIFELYLQRMRGRGKLLKAAQTLHQAQSAAKEDSSPLMRRTAKRKIIESDSDEEQQVPATELVAFDDSSDFEQVAATQMQETPPRARAKQKRRKFNSFIVEEAEQSGSDHDEEAEHTVGGYIKDSVIISSDEENDGHNDTNTHAMYLQGLRSPVHRPGAFKMPAPRSYQNVLDIYSQPVFDEPSQYMPCSFIVDENADEAPETQDVSECPLERAERILKEQRRAKRRAATGSGSGGQTKRRRVQRVVSSSSSDDEVVFVK